MHLVVFALPHNNTCVFPNIDPGSTGTNTSVSSRVDSVPDSNIYLPSGVAAGSADTESSSSNTCVPATADSVPCDNTYVPSGFVPCSTVPDNVPVFGDGSVCQSKNRKVKGYRQCPGCQQLFVHPRRRYCDKCHEDCAKTPKMCMKCDQFFTSPNICRKFCDNCQKKPSSKSEELKRNCFNCCQEFVTANSCRRYCDNCRSKSKELTPKKCASCNSDFFRSKQLRKYCESCRVKARGEILPRKCLQCENIFTDSNVRRKLCFPCRKRSDLSKPGIVPLEVSQCSGNWSQTGSGNSLQLECFSVKENHVESKDEYETNTKSQAEDTELKDNEAVISRKCSLCGTTFISTDFWKNICCSCEPISPEMKINPRPCAVCKQPFTTSDNTRTHCEICEGKNSIQCIECQKKFLPSALNSNRCDNCCGKDKEPTRHAKCEKCSSILSDGKRFCCRCQETKKESVPKKCAGCDTYISHTPRKFCDTCREEKEKPQVSTQLYISSLKHFRSRGMSMLS